MFYNECALSGRVDAVVATALMLLKQKDKKESYEE
jgi:hypothetical protein